MRFGDSDANRGSATCAGPLGRAGRPLRRTPRHDSLLRYGTLSQTQRGHSHGNASKFSEKSGMSKFIIPYLYIDIVDKNLIRIKNL